MTTTATIDESSYSSRKSIFLVIIAIAVIIGMSIVMVNSLTRSVVRWTTFDEISLRRATVTNVALPAIERLPQNSWLIAQRDALRALSDGEEDGGGGWCTGTKPILWADVVHRNTDGLIIIRPLRWYVYYVRGDIFYYLTSTFSDGLVCAADECSVVVLEPVAPVQQPNGDGENAGGGGVATKRNHVPRTACLGCTRLELIKVFFHEP